MIGYSFVLMHRKLAKNKKNYVATSNRSLLVIFFLVPVFNKQQPSSFTFDCTVQDGCS
jgi:hypothetical protein